MTIRKWVDIAQWYEDYPILFLSPEWEAWFANTIMSNYLKLALEQKEIRYESMTAGTIRFKFKSYFAANYNVRSRGYGYSEFIKDPDFRAIEDRCICRYHQMRLSRFLDILDAIEEHALGRSYRKLAKSDITPQILRAHASILYAINTGDPRFADKFKPAAIRFTEKQIKTVKRAATQAVEFVSEYKSKDQKDPSLNISPRVVQRCIQLAASLTLPFYFASNSKVWNGHSIIFARDDAITRAIAYMLDEIAYKHGIKPEEMAKYVGVMLRGNEL
jgi:hypothetical protein